MWLTYRGRGLIANHCTRSAGVWLCSPKKKGGEEVSYRKWRVVTLTWLPVVLFSLVVELLQDEEVDDIRHVVVPVAGAQRQMYICHFNESTSEPSQGL